MGRNLHSKFSTQNSALKNLHSKILHSKICAQLILSSRLLLRALTSRMFSYFVYYKKKKVFCKIHLGEKDSGWLFPKKRIFIFFILFLFLFFSLCVSLSVTPQLWVNGGWIFTVYVDELIGKSISK